MLVLAMLPLACIVFYLALPLALPEPRTPPSYISFNFVGYTNDPSGDILARFIIANVSKFNVRSGPGFAYNFMTNDTFPREHQWIASPVPQQILKPGDTLSVALPAPTNRIPWRVRAGAERLPSRLERMGLFLRRFLPAKLQFFPDRILYVREKYTGWTGAYSAAIEPNLDGKRTGEHELKLSAPGAMKR